MKTVTKRQKHQHGERGTGALSSVSALCCDLVKLTHQLECFCSPLGVSVLESCCRFDHFRGSTSHIQCTDSVHKHLVKLTSNFAKINIHLIIIFGTVH